jgi:hypothetical protein
MTAGHREVPPAFMTPSKAREVVRKLKSVDPAPHSPAHPAAESADGVIKTFVVDTNVLLHNPNALFVFKEHHVVIPFAVVEELDADEAEG